MISVMRLVPLQVIGLQQGPAPMFAPSYRIMNQPSNFEQAMRFSRLNDRVLTTVQCLRAKLAIQTWCRSLCSGMRHP